MQVNVRLIVVALTLCAMGTPVTAREPNCASISDHKARTACHTQTRRAYGTTLEFELFDTISHDGNVFVLEMGEPGTGAYPMLVIWTTILSENKMKEMITKGAILDGARKAGFRMLVFVDKGQDRNWYFDLTKPANSPRDVVAPPSPPWMQRSSR